MIINGKSIQGIFLYSGNLEFEKNDFVISGNSIYICTAKYPTNLQNQTVSGEDPKISSKNFQLYPGEMISSREEFDEYFRLLKGENSYLPDDRLVSSYVVADVLQDLHFGLSLSGVISEFVEETDESPLPLDDLIKSSINNGTVYLSPTISQIQDIVPIIGPVNTETQNYNLVLRQYTYIGEKTDTNENRYVRVQELINPYTGYTAFRYTIRNNESGNFGETISTWRTSYTYSGVGSIHDNEISYTLKALESFYTTRMNQMSSLLNNLRGTFRFRKLDIVFVNPGEYKIEDHNVGITTFTIKSAQNKYETLTYDFSFDESSSVSDVIKLNFSETYEIQIIYKNGIYITDNYIHLIIPTSCTIIDAYRRENYETN